MAVAAAIETVGAIADSAMIGIFAALRPSAVIEGIGRWRPRGDHRFRFREEGQDGFGRVHAGGDAAIADVRAVEVVKDVAGRAKVREGGEGKPARCAIEPASDLAECRIPDTRNLLAEIGRAELVWKVANIDRVKQRAARLPRVAHPTKCWTMAART
jgi:hypothetical protein